MLRTKYIDPQGFLNYNTSGFGTVVDRFRWEAGCIVEHVSDIVPFRLLFYFICFCYVKMPFKGSSSRKQDHVANLPCSSIVGCRRGFPWR